MFENISNTCYNHKIIMHLYRTAMKKLGDCLTDKELDDMMKQADINGDGKIDYEGMSN